jgi:hypothetical protein
LNCSGVGTSRCRVQLMPNIVGLSLCEFANEREIGEQFVHGK